MVHGRLPPYLELRPEYPDDDLERIEKGAERGRECRGPGYGGQEEEGDSCPTSSPERLANAPRNFQNTTLLCKAHYIDRYLLDLSELSLGSTMKTEFPDPDDILNFVLTIEPDEGMYRAAKFTFDFNINQNFPHDPPKVRCREKIYHPNIDLEGKVCLNILREDWKPVLNLNAVIVGLQVRHMFTFITHAALCR
jgi:hypothetical protein